MKKSRTFPNLHENVPGIRKITKVSLLGKKKSKDAKVIKAPIVFSKKSIFRIEFIIIFMIDY